jgi:hypothetical protein
MNTYRAVFLQAPDGGAWAVERITGGVSYGYGPDRFGAPRLRRCSWPANGSGGRLGRRKAVAEIDVKKLVEVVVELQKKQQDMVQRLNALHNPRDQKDDPGVELKKLGARLDALEKRVDTLEKAAKKK